MLIIEKVKGVTLPDAGPNAPRVEVDEATTQFAALPGWGARMQPLASCYDRISGEVIDRVNGKNRFRNGSTPPNPPLGTFSNGKPCFDMRTVGDINYGAARFIADAPINANAWTAYVVFQSDDTGVLPDNFFNPISGYTSDQYALRLAYRGDGAIIIMKGDTTQRLTWSPGTAIWTDNKPHLIVATGSSKGLTIWHNGIQVATNGDGNPLTHLKVGMLSVSQRVADRGWFNLDYSTAENAAHMTKLQKYLMDIYGISA